MVDAHVVPTLSFPLLENKDGSLFNSMFYQILQGEVQDVPTTHAMCAQTIIV